MRRPLLLVVPGKEIRLSRVAEWLRTKRVSILNVAGNRESTAPDYTLGLRPEPEPALAAEAAS